MDHPENASIHSTDITIYLPKASVVFWVLSQRWVRDIQARMQSVLKLLYYRCILVPASVQFSSVTKSCQTLCDLMNHSMPGLPVHHKLLEFTQTHLHRVSDAIQTSHPLSSPSPPAPKPSQHQGRFQWVNSSPQMAKVLEFQPQHQSFQRTPRAGL